ncbi:hypothetical protein ACR15_002120 [Escherichia coli]|nr:hypothetical protein [Escherichia coli]EFL3935126.1 hypothetical protein [Escherichia coli]ELT6819605.1 hypothetical protein [Escherichia coli]
MATFGAYLRLDNGNVFVTPDATPMCLYKRLALTSSNQTIAIPDGRPVMAFLRMNTDSICMTYRMSSSTLFVGAGNGTAYIFSVFPQTKPTWGMAIWNASGELVLTNESKILTDLVTVGEEGANGGIYIDQYLTGSYAVCPQLLGAQVGQGSASIYTAAYYNGTTTRIHGIKAGSVYSPQGYINHGRSITAIKTDAYD